MQYKDKWIPLAAVILAAALAFAGCAGNSASGEQPAEVDAVSVSATDGTDRAAEFLERDPPDDSGHSGSGSETVEVIRGGYSTKAFTEERVSDADLQLILECGAKSPSARNGQPWFFTVVRNTELAAQIVPAATEGTVVIVVSGKTTEQEGTDPVLDCALAAQSMYIAAQSLGLGTHLYTGPVGAVNASYWEALSMPPDYEAVVILCVGHTDAPEDAVSSATGRKPLDEVVEYVG